MKGPQTIEDSSRKGATITIVERESKIARVKRMLTGHVRNPLTYDEAKANCKARKRKERQESVSSISQERKVIRSNSEERPNLDKDAKNEIRRVSSHEDFQKKPAENDECSADRHKLTDLSVDYFIYDDYEHECRRSKERFSRSVAQKGRYSSQHKKPKAKQFPKTHQKDKAESKPELAQPDSLEDRKTNFLQLHQEEKERSPSPVHTPVSPAIDLSTLHQQIDGSEPLPSTSNRLEHNETISSLSIVSNRLLSSPRNSVISTQRIYLNPDVPQSSSELGQDSLNPLEQRLKHLSKQIKSAKKKIKKYDEEFEMKFGYKPSHADKLYDKSIKKLCADLTKLKKEQKQLKEDSASILIAASGNLVETPEGKPAITLQDTLTEIEKKLSTKRQHADRSCALEEMSSDELMEEKVAVQKALLYLQSVHGRPNNKEDKDMVRPLYDRYRLLKRMVARVTMTSGNLNELATIHEHETMDFISQPSPAVEIEQTDKLKSSTDSDTDTSIGENLHALTLDELEDQKRTTCEEKKQLRRGLKEFENDFQLKNGRKLQKDDKQSMETVYSSYKKAKAKLRLIEALIEKQKM